MKVRAALDGTVLHLHAPIIGALLDPVEALGLAVLLSDALLSLSVAGLGALAVLDCLRAALDNPLLGATVLNGPGAPLDIRALGAILDVPGATFDIRALSARLDGSGATLNIRALGASLHGPCATLDVRALGASFDAPDAPLSLLTTLRARRRSPHAPLGGALARLGSGLGGPCALFAAVCPCFRRLSLLSPLRILAAAFPVPLGLGGGGNGKRRNCRDQICSGHRSSPEKSGQL